MQPDQALLGLPGIMAAPRGPRRDKSLLDEAARIEGSLRPTKVRRKMTVDELVHKKLMDNFRDYDKITIDGTIVDGKSLRERLIEDRHEHMYINTNYMSALYQWSSYHNLHGR